MLNNKYYNLGAQPSAIRKLFAYGLDRKQEIGDDKVFDFSIGNPSIPAPKQVKDVLSKLIDIEPVSLHSYSMGSGLPEVRKAIADSIKNTHNFPANFEHIFVTSGAAGAIAASMKAVVNPDEEIVLISPFFAEYKMWAKEATSNVIEVPAKSDTFEIDVELLKKSLSKKTALIVVNSPSNPTGVVYSEQNIKDLATALKDAENKFSRDIFILADEPYRKIAYDCKVPYIPNFYNNTIVTDSASKSLSMPGERIGHVFVSSTANNADDVFLAVAGAARALGHVCAPVLFQRLYAECINLPADISQYKYNRELLMKILNKYGFDFVIPMGAFYLWMKSPLEDAQEFSDLAKKYELLIVPSDSFGCPGWVRLGFCVSENTIRNSESAWEKLADELKSKGYLC